MVAPTALARGRTPLGGKLTFTVPLPTSRLDPHDPFDSLAALIGHAVFDPLYGSGPLGPVPVLAEALPRMSAGKVLVPLRSGLRTAGGRAIGFADVEHSLQRAAVHSPLIAAAGKPERVRGEQDTIAFAAPMASVLAALSSPLAAIASKGSTPSAPDGTGAFSVRLGAAEAVLSRSLMAATGPSFLESITLRRAASLEACLRDFEAERSDWGWLGMGLFAARPGAQAFALGSLGAVVLSATPQTEGLSQRGATQRLVDLLPRSRLAHTGLSGLGEGSAGVRWEARPVDLFVESGNVQLEEVASPIAAVLSQPQHEVTVRKVTGAKLAEARTRREPALALTLVRSASRQRMAVGGALAKLEGGDGRGLDAVEPRRACAELHSGVVGELLLRGGVIAGLRLATDQGQLSLPNSSLRAATRK